MIETDGLERIPPNEFSEALQVVAVLKLTVPCPEPTEIRGDLPSGGAEYRLEIKKSL